MVLSPTRACTQHGGIRRHVFCYNASRPLKQTEEHSQKALQPTDMQMSSSSSVLQIAMQSSVGSCTADDLDDASGRRPIESVGGKDEDLLAHGTSQAIKWLVPGLGKALLRFLTDSRTTSIYDSCSTCMPSIADLQSCVRSSFLGMPTYNEEPSLATSRSLKRLLAYACPRSLTCLACTCCSYQASQTILEPAQNLSNPFSRAGTRHLSV